MKIGYRVIAVVGCALLLLAFAAEVKVQAGEMEGEKDSNLDAWLRSAEDGKGALLLSIPLWSAEINQAGANFGYCVAGAGDVNGDGYGDVIVGALYYDNGNTDEGAAFLYYGSASGISATPDWIAEGNQNGAYLGGHVACAGDVNNDGYSDIIVSSNGYDNGQTNEGRAIVYHGGPSGPSTSPDWSVESDRAEAYFGFPVAGAGDVNGDGYSDVIVGDDLYDGGQTDEGRAHVFHGGPSGLSTSAAWSVEGNQDNALFGVCLAGAGDVNGDGYSDVIVAAKGYDNGQTDEGRVYVYHGGPSGLSTSPAWTAEGNQDGAQLGTVAGAGDVNGDGYYDVIVGAPTFSNGETAEGRAYVYHGGASGLSSTPAWIAEGDQGDARFGRSVAGAGDVNCDGYSDVIVGAWMYDNGQTDEGAAFVYHGSAGGLSTTADWMAEGDQDFSYFAWSAAGAGNVDGAGCSEVIVGARDYTNGEADEGCAYVYKGYSEPVPILSLVVVAIGTALLVLGGASGYRRCRVMRAQNNDG